MPNLRFEWDPRKNAANKRKHGVSFDEARTVFYDERALFAHFADRERSFRSIVIGRFGDRERSGATPVSLWR